MTDHREDGLPLHKISIPTPIAEQSPRGYCRINRQRERVEIPSGPSPRCGRSPPGQYWRMNKLMILLVSSLVLAGCSTTGNNAKGGTGDLGGQTTGAGNSGASWGPDHFGQMDGLDHSPVGSGIVASGR